MEGRVAQEPRYIVQAFRRRRGALAPSERYEASGEDAVVRRGLAMRQRVDGLAFFKIETSGEGDLWAEVELLGSVGDVPDEEAA